MKICNLQIRCCRRESRRFTASTHRTGNFRSFDFLVVTLHTDDGLSASTVGFAGKSAEGAGLLIVQWQQGVPITIYPAKDAVSKPIWPTK